MANRQEKPNVVVFFTDQQRWDTTGVHGNPLNLTPNFDRMAQRGTHLYNAFTPQPVCGPARAVLQTGQYATAVGCWRNGIPLPPDSRTLAHYFGEAGYHTAYIGKWHLADGKGPVASEQRGGYQYWLGANVLEAVSDAYNAIVYDGDNREVKLPGYRVDALTDAAIRYIDAHQNEPFFLFISYLEPHFQNHRDDYPAPEVYKDCYIGRYTPPDLQVLIGNAPQHLGGYYGMVRRLDEALGRLLDALQSLNLSDNTIVVFTTDHGCHFRTRNSEYKRSCHESSIRIPMAIQGPGFDSGGQIRELVSLIDLPPTLLEAAGIPAPPPGQMHGHSFMRLLRGDRKGWPDDVFIQISESQVGRAIRTKRWKYGVTAPDKHGGKYSCSDVYEEEYLYDLQADPYELTNLIGWQSHQEVAARLRERLLRRLAETGEGQAEIRPAPVRKSGQRRVFAEEIDA
ncbi:MAG TPA: sulfatase-like hydrolase/transferase [Firmicutes bacterium]|nr:sulfatase-like hydrolase/transferase [Bacillota bacterium]